MVIAASGHRMLSNPHLAKSVALRALDYFKPQKVLCGMALGWDSAVAEGCLEVDIPLVAAIPFRGQEQRWAGPQQERYHHLLGQAQSVWVASPLTTKEAFLARNRYMVDQADLILVAFEGRPGGTAYTIRYALERGKKVLNMAPVLVGERARFMGVGP